MWSESLFLFTLGVKRSFPWLALYRESDGGAGYLSTGVVKGVAALYFSKMFFMDT